MISIPRAREKYAVPIFISLVVVPLALALLTIGARSPYTQANLNPHYDASYVRTDQSFVGTALPIVAPPPTALPGADPVSRGQQLFTAQRCSSCHGLDGRGGVIGPSIVGVTAAKLRSKMHAGPGAMPPFDLSLISNDDLAAMAAYLASMKQ